MIGICLLYNTYIFALGFHRISLFAWEWHIIKYSRLSGIQHVSSTPVDTSLSGVSPHEAFSRVIMTLPILNQPFGLPRCVSVVYIINYIFTFWTKLRTPHHLVLFSV